MTVERRHGFEGLVFSRPDGSTLEILPPKPLLCYFCREAIEVPFYFCEAPKDGPVTVGTCCAHRINGLTS